MKRSAEDLEALTRLGTQIRQLRESKGLSSAEVARRLYMERGNYSRIETGKMNPSYLILCRLARMLECDIKEFLA